MKIKKIWCVLLLPFAFAAKIAMGANADWHTEFPALKIAGNLYYVGTTDLAGSPAP